MSGPSGGPTAGPTPDKRLYQIIAILGDPSVAGTALSRDEIAKLLQERHTNAKMSSLQSLRNSIGWYLCMYRGTAFRRIKRGRWTLQDENIQTVFQRLKSVTRRRRINTPAENLVHNSAVAGRSRSRSQPSDFPHDRDSFLPRNYRPAERGSSPTAAQLPTFNTAFSDPSRSQNSVSASHFFPVGSRVGFGSTTALSSSRSIVGPSSPMLTVNFEDPIEVREPLKPPSHEPSLVDWRLGEVYAKSVAYGKSDTDPRTPFLEDLLPDERHPDPGSFLPEVVNQQVAPTSTIPYFLPVGFPVNTFILPRCLLCGQQLAFNNVVAPTEVPIRPSQEHTRLSVGTSGHSEESILSLTDLNTEWPSSLQSQRLNLSGGP